MQQTRLMFYNMEDKNEDDWLYGNLAEICLISMSRCLYNLKCFPSFLNYFSNLTQTFHHFPLSPLNKIKFKYDLMRM